MKNEEQARFLFGISLSDRPIWKQFLICSSGFFFGYLVNGVCEEYVYNRLQFSYGWYFTFVQGFVYLFLIYLQGFTPKQMVNPWKTYVKLSAVLPVMVMGAFIPGLRRKYPAHEYVSAILLVVGLILFTLADAQTSPNFSVIGVVMITGALVMDSFLDNLQEAIFTLDSETIQVIYALMLVQQGSSWKHCDFTFNASLIHRWKCSFARQWSVKNSHIIMVLPYDLLNSDEYLVMSSIYTVWRVGV
ncbi:hypothetical protein GQ457_05G000420 [Hibiscus cannabinus]